MINSDMAAARGLAIGRLGLLQADLEMVARTWPDAVPDWLIRDMERCAAALTWLPQGAAIAERLAALRWGHPSAEEDRLCELYGLVHGLLLRLSVVAAAAEVANGPDDMEVLG